ncbi:hypothetical protein BC830DRAFT_1163502 [Chytriomyces sp. MP71]|nr:hypothetical protein BC830DRAFT_1163502 [Chytriomyces sp. MP71]
MHTDHRESNRSSSRSKEMGKFLIYIMFPVGSLYLFNRPDMQEKLLRRSSVPIHVEMGVPEEELVKNIPRTRAEAQAQIGVMKKAHQERLAAAEAPTQDSSKDS